MANLPAAPRATLSDEFASSSDDEVNSNAGSTGSMVRGWELCWLQPISVKGLRAMLAAPDLRLGFELYVVDKRVKVLNIGTSSVSYNEKNVTFSFA